MPEFTLYFTDADDASAAQRRIETRLDPIETIADVRTDLASRLEERRHDPDFILGTAREVQKRIREIPINVTWPAAHDDYGHWEIIVEARSMPDVQQIVGVDLDYSWEETA